MNRRTTTEADGQARVVRAAETKFLVERYHRAFQDEAEYLRGLVKVWLAADRWNRAHFQGKASQHPRQNCSFVQVCGPVNRPKPAP
jgi:hypothetical protein